MMNLKPLDNKIVVQPREADTITPGGIHLPDRSKEEKARGTVLAVGPGKLLDSGERASLSVKVDDDVIYSKWSGSDIELDGETYKILSEDDLLAVVG